MKKVLYLVLKNTVDTADILVDLREKGFNATIMSTESLRHALEYTPAAHHFFSLRHMENETLQESMMGIFIVDETSSEILKREIREQTENFSKVKGFMYTQDLSDYEGTI